MAIIDHLEALGLRYERVPLSEVDDCDALRGRLCSTGDFYQLGQRYHFRPDGLAAWSLPPSWLSFMQHGGLRIFRDGALRLDVLTPHSAVLATDELIDALSDHRYGKWPHEQPENFGLDRCVVFALEPGWMNGWAFDTRFRHDDDECCIRRIVDFSADDAEMQRIWSPNDTADGTVEAFDVWLRAFVGSLAS